MPTLYGIRNNALTTSKSCKRAAVLTAIESDGHAYGVASADGTLEVINKTEALARKWREEQNDHLRRQTGYAREAGRVWERTVEKEDLQVVKVYGSKAAAMEAVESVTTSTELTEEDKERSKALANEERLVTLDRRLAAAEQMGLEADAAVLRLAIRIAECSESRTIA